MKEKLLEIINNYGVMPQLKYFQSEIFELNEAIMEYEHDEYNYYEPVEENHKSHIAEEIADVMVMLKQFQYHYKIRDEHIEVIMEQKIDRQLERIANEKKERR